LEAIDAGATIALANKEVLVMAGELVKARSQSRGVSILPVDSEHAGVAQALAERSPNGQVRRVILTASGGPFRKFTSEALHRVSPSEALRHPTWEMGPKITIDSASLMNKGLELIEAKWLFNLAPDQVDVLIHPESVVHALVEFIDGSLLAQMSVPDMRLPISQALSHPERIPCRVERLDLAQIGSLHFEEPNLKRFPCLGHAKAALQEGGTAPAVLNAANEMAVAAYLDESVGFMDIPAVVGAALDAHGNEPATELDPILEADRWGRGFALFHLNGARCRIRR
jgi:1-deoxy-D-xylulose-5-phosphate reductoisomerase